ncbi:uncharacterized protein LOC108734072 [Agrilus planipennis]|uniref:Uncharacterized protein LOC108734072 n=1 Tax=Agrilus planipennis TaxID=224129 RepID=A0A1W4WLP1_AGRPL|nr:uncharacterized protein LOC108734072 [Agrilus planipennis]
MGRVEMYFLWCTSVSFIFMTTGIPVNGTEKNFADSTEENSLNDTNNSTGDLLIISSYVYEVGILTNENTTNSNNTSDEQGEVTVSLLSSLPNGTLLSFSNISSPQQANITGHFSSAMFPLPPLSAFIIATLSDKDNSTNDTLPSILVDALEDFSSTDPKKTKEALANLPSVLGLQQLGDIIDDNSTDSKDQQNQDDVKKEKERSGSITENTKEVAENDKSGDGGA